jgi:acyl-coenzyme A thioesterase PaaI-like protein
MAPRSDPISFHSLYDSEPSPEIAASRRAADEARRVLRALVATVAPAADLDAVAATLAELADRIEPHAPAVSRYEGTAGIDFRAGSPESRAQVFESHPILGPSNPLAPPVHVYPAGADGVVVGTATYGAAYEGPPGCVHGGMLAAAFDIILGAASVAAQRPALTGTLTVRYRKGTPLHREIRYEGRLDRVEGRRTHVAARALVDGEVTAEAEGVFVSVDPARLRGGDRPGVGPEPGADPDPGG